MKPDATTVRHKYWIRQKMVGIHQHGGQHNEPCFFPVFLKKQPCHQTWEQEMKAIMDYGLEHYVYGLVPKLSLFRIGNQWLIKFD